LLKAVRDARVEALSGFRKEVAGGRRDSACAANDLLALSELKSIQAGP